MTKTATLPVLLAEFRQHEAAYDAALKQSEDHPELSKIADAENACISAAVNVRAATWPDLLAKAELSAEAVRKLCDQDEFAASLLSDLRAFAPPADIEPGHHPNRAALVRSIHGDIKTALEHAEEPLTLYSLQRAEKAMAALFPATKPCRQPRAVLPLGRALRKAWAEHSATDKAGDKLTPELEARNRRAFDQIMALTDAILCAPPVTLAEACHVIAAAIERVSNIKEGDGSPPHWFGMIEDGLSRALALAMRQAGMAPPDLCIAERMNADTAALIQS